MMFLRILTAGRPYYSRWRRGCALGRDGLGSQKIPKNETEHRQKDHQNRPENFLSRICAALKDVDNCPYIGDQNYETEQALVLHLLSSLLFPRRYATPL